MGKQSRRIHAPCVKCVPDIECMIDYENATGFVVDPTIERDTFQNQLLDDADTVVVEVERRETAAESVAAFTRSVNRLSNPGVRLFNGRLTPVKGLVVIMFDVGVVLRHQDGSRARCECHGNGAGCCATLWWQAADDTHYTATLGKHVAKANFVSVLPR